MGIYAFVLKFDVTGEQFLSTFLASPDFDNNGLEKIASQLSISYLKGKKSVSGILSAAIANPHLLEPMIFEILIAKHKNWATVRFVHQFKRPIELAPARELLWNKGKEQWYGPIEDTEESECWWYIRPA